MRAGGLDYSLGLFLKGSDGDQVSKFLSSDSSSKPSLLNMLKQKRDYARETCSHRNSWEQRDFLISRRSTRRFCRQDYIFSLLLLILYIHALSRPPSHLFFSFSFFLSFKESGHKNNWARRRRPATQTTVYGYDGKWTAVSLLCCNLRRSVQVV